MVYLSPDDFLKSLLDDDFEKIIIDCISKRKDPEEILDILIHKMDDAND